MLVICVSLLACFGCGPAPIHDHQLTAPLPPGTNFVGGNLEPLIVDWQAEQRGDLEIAMRSGIVVVAYDDKGLKLLPNCRTEGTYGFIGLTRRERVVRLESEYDIQANLPLAGLGLAARFGGELKRGATLDVAMVMIGQLKTTRTRVAKSELAGDCAEATHVIRGATVGAFAVDRGSRSKSRAVAEIFGAGGSGGSESSSMMRIVDGRLSDCQSAAPDSIKPPPQCGAMMRLLLATLSQEAGEPATPNGSSAPKAIGWSELSDVCGKGLVLVEGKCTPEGQAKSKALAYECSYGDVQGCQRQCNANNAKSCRYLALMNIRGEHVPRAANGTPERKNQVLASIGFAGKACAKGDPYGCSLLGIVMENVDEQKALNLYRNACDNGAADGCMFIGLKYLNGAGGLPRDTQRAASFLSRGCEGGSQSACAALGELSLGGQGFPQDLPKASALFERGCQGGDDGGCMGVAMLQEFGLGRPKDIQRAAATYERPCQRQSRGAPDCTGLGMLYETGKGVSGKNPSKAAELYRHSCQKGFQIACAFVRAFIDPNQTVDLSDSGLGSPTKVWQGSCGAGIARHCSFLGVTTLASGRTEQGRALFAKACQLGDDWACTVGGGGVAGGAIPGGATAGGSLAGDPNAGGSISAGLAALTPPTGGFIPPEQPSSLPPMSPPPERPQTPSAPPGSSPLERLAGRGDESASPEPDPDAPKGGSTGPWIVMGIGGAAGIVSGVLGVMVLRKEAELGASCPGGACPPSQQENLDSTRSLAKASTYTLIGGGAFLLGGLVWYLFDGSGSTKKSSGIRPTAGGLAF